jgi:hypothetical protein
MARQDQFDLFTIGRNHNPVTDGNFGPNIADPDRFDAHRWRAVPNSAPTSVKSRDPARQIGPIEHMWVISGNFSAR